jgi:hypothetical protein
MLECPGTQRMSVAIPCARTGRALLLIWLADRCPGPRSWCGVHLITACESLKTATGFIWCTSSVSLDLTISTSASPIAHSSALKTSICPVPIQPRPVLLSLPCLLTSGAPTLLSSERDPSVHHILTPAPTFTPFSLAQCCVALLAVLLSTNIMVFTTRSLPGAGQLMYSVVWLCSGSVSTTHNTSVPDEGSACSLFSSLLDALASLTVNCCCLEFKITGTGVRPVSLINARLGIVGSAPRTDLAYPFSRSWRSSRRPTSLGSHQSFLPYCATAWTQATWTAPMLAGTTSYVFVRVQSLTSAAQAIFMHRLWCSLNIRCASIQTPSQRIASLLNNLNPFLTFIFAVSFGQRYVFWPQLHINSATSAFARSNCSPPPLADSILMSAHRSSFMTT